MNRLEEPKKTVLAKNPYEDLDNMIQGFVNEVYKMMEPPLLCIIRKINSRIAKLSMKGNK